MKKRFLLLGFLLVMGLSLVLAQAAFAADPAPAAAGDEAPSLASILSSPPEPLDPQGHVQRFNLSALIKGITTIRGAAGFLLTFVLSFVGVVALFILVISGYRYITAFGGDTAKAKQAIAGVVIGIIIIVGAWAIVTTAINAFGPAPLNLPI